MYLAPGKKLTDVVGVGVAGSNDHVHVWYSNSTVSPRLSGTSLRHVVRNAG